MRYNGNKFSVYESEEKTVLGLLGELGSQVNHNTEDLEKVKESDNKKVSHDEMNTIYKIDKNADFTGSWYGIKKPTASQEGLQTTVDKIVEEDIPSINEQLETNITYLDNKKLDRNESNSISMGMLTQEVKTSMTGDKVAVVGTDSVGLVQLTTQLQDDISSYKTVDVTKELYSADISSSNKVTISSSIYYDHAVLNVSEGERYIISLTTQTNPSAYYLIFANDSLDVISKDLTNQTVNQVVTKDITVPTGATKMYINTKVNTNISVSKKSYVGIVNKEMYSDTVTELEKTSNITNEIFNVLRTTEEINSTRGEYSYNNVNGVATLSNSSYYDHIIADIVDYSSVAVTFNTQTNTSVVYVYLVDDSFKIISSFCTNYSSFTNVKDYEIKIPIGATKIIVNTKDGTQASVKKYVVGEIKGNNSNELYPSYYNDYLEDKINEINEFEKAYGTNGESFIFITDIHVEDNAMQSHKLIQEIVNKTNVNKIICGGDLITSFPQTEERMFKQAYDFINAYRNIQGAKLYLLSGNHDIMAFKGDNTTSGQWNVTDDMRYSILYKHQEEYVVSNPNELKSDYFYFDNKIQKIRYICVGQFDRDLDTKTGVEYQPTQTQLDWITNNALTGIDNTWTLIFFGHAGITTATGDSWSISRPGFAKLKTLIENQKENFNVVGYFGGHMHRDIHDLNNGINHILISCDAMYNDNGYARTGGTVNEVCFDVVTINKATKEINLVRIGAGINRKYNY